MTGLAIFDLVIGVIFIFFLLSIITSSAVEVLLSLFKIRANMLANWLIHVFSNTSLLPNGTPNIGVKLGEAIMDHCMTTVLSPKKKSTVYISSSDFTNAFLDQITRVPTTVGMGFVPPPPTLKNYITAITGTTVISDELKRTILAFADEAASTFSVSTTGGTIAAAKSEIDLFKEKIAKWYDSNAQRLVGRLKSRWAFPFSLILAIFISISMNVDTVQICRYLYDHKEVSKSLADKATSTYTQYEEQVNKIKANPSDSLASGNLDSLKQATLQLKQNIDTLKSLLPADFPLGWGNEKWKDSTIEDMSGLDRVVYLPFWGEAIGNHGAGWLATILALLLGAPFWFDLLNKIANIRAAGPKPASTLKDTAGNTTINS